MTTHTYRTVHVDAWQHTAENIEAIESNDTVPMPGFLIKLLGEGAMRVVGDGSIHVNLADGSIAPLPINYWLVQKPDSSLGIYAPDRFDAEFEEVPSLD